MAYPENAALHRRQQTAMLEGCAETLISISCSAEGCRNVETAHTDTAAVAKAAFQKGWRSAALGEDSPRSAFCPDHARERGLR